MSALASRVTQAIGRVGDPFIVGVQARIGWFRIASYSRALLYATPTEFSTYPLPVRTLTVPAADPTGVGDTVVWDSQSLTVRKAVNLRVRGQTVARVLLVA